MAGDVVEAFIQQGTLYVYGTQHDDQIEIRFSQGQIEIPGVAIKTEQGELVSKVDRSEVPYQVIATGQAGDDRIEVVEDGDAALPVVFFGNQGNDTLIGGSNEDALVGQDGIDYLFGNGGNDKLIAAQWADDRDPVQPDDVAELLDGGAGDDLLWGSGGADYLVGGEGNDVLNGLGGADFLIGGTGSNFYDGGAGNDMIEEFDLQGGTISNERLSVTRRFDDGSWFQSSIPITSIERVYLQAADDAEGVVLDATAFSGDATLVGSQNADVLKSGSGNDTLVGLGGDDQFTAGAGTNSIDGGSGRDAIFEQIGLSNVTLNDVLYSSSNVTSTLLSVEAANFTESPRAILARATLSRYSSLGGFRLLGSREPSFQFPAAAPQHIDARGFSGELAIRSTQGIDRTFEYLGRGQLSVNPNAAQFAITVKYNSLGGTRGVLGTPVSDEGIAADGVGHYRHYQHGSIFWSPDSGAHVVYGDIRNKWISLGWERGGLGYPTSDEYDGPGGWRVSHFQNGTIVWRDGVSHLSFNRVEMIRFLTKLGSDGVTAGEINSLRHIVNDSGTFMPDDVHYLARQVADTDLSIPRFGNPLDWAIGHYFYGTDHPLTQPDVHYTESSWRLFGATGQPQLADVEQGQVGDCFFMAALMDVVVSDPQAIKNMFIDNGDGTYSVRFFRNGVAEYVTVDRELPTKTTLTGAFDPATYEALEFANQGRDPQYDTGIGLWAALAEKAFAQWKGGNEGYETIEDKGGLNGGKVTDALYNITGKAAHFISLRDYEWHSKLLDVLYAGGHVVWSTEDNPVDITDPRLVEDHAYLMTAIGSNGLTFEVMNPWGYDNLNGPAATELDEFQLIQNFQGFSYYL